MPAPSPDNSRHQPASPVTLKAGVPQSPERLFIDDLNQRIDALVNRASGLLNVHLDSPDLTLSIGGKFVQAHGVVAKGFANVIGFTQPALTAAERESRVSALIQEKTQQLLAAPPALVADYAAHMSAFGGSIAVKPGDAGLSPVEMKNESDRIFIARLKSEVENIIRAKVDKLENGSRELREIANSERIEFF